jgi:hypothetical protein
VLGEGSTLMTLARIGTRAIMASAEMEETDRQPR